MHERVHVSMGMYVIVCQHAHVLVCMHASMHMTVSTYMCICVYKHVSLHGTVLVGMY